MKVLSIGQRITTPLGYDAGIVLAVNDRRRHHNLPYVKVLWEDTQNETWVFPYEVR